MTETVFKALLMDLDGTLADSLELMRRVYDSFLEGFGRKGSDEEFERLNGPPLRVGVEMLRQSHGLPGDTDRLLARYQGLAAGGYAKYSRPTLGARRLLALARVRGLSTALVTSAPLDLAEEFLTHHKLIGSFDVVVGAESVERGKPAPDPYREALHRLELSPHWGLALEDTPIGVASAAAAGLTVWGVSRRGGEGPLRAAGAAALVEDLAQAADWLEAL